MKFAVGVVVSVCACGPQLVHYEYPSRLDVDHTLDRYPVKRLVPFPTTPESKPWKVGQWALYKIEGSPLGYAKISVIAEDTCGLWLLVERNGYSGSDSRKYCVQPPSERPVGDPFALRVAIWESNHEPPVIRDFRSKDAPAAERLALLPELATWLPRSWPVDVPREDIEVPAGHFVHAVREEWGGPSTPHVRWSHPAVPFGGIVRTQEHHNADLVLLDYGESTDARGVITILERKLARPRPVHPVSDSFMSVGYGHGRFTGAGAEASSGAEQFVISYGARIRDNLDFISVVELSNANYSPDATLSQGPLNALVGVRWSPFRLAKSDFNFGFVGAPALFVEGEVGYARLERYSPTDMTAVAHGAGVRASIGWLGFQQAWFVAGLEASETLEVFNSGEGVRHNLGVTVVFQLLLPSRGFGR